MLSPHEFKQLASRMVSSTLGLEDCGSWGTLAAVSTILWLLARRFSLPARLVPSSKACGRAQQKCFSGVLQDVNRDGTIGFDEFVTSLLDWHTVQHGKRWGDMVLRAFHRLDNDGDGFISVPDLTAILTRGGTEKDAFSKVWWPVCWNRLSIIGHMHPAGMGRSVIPGLA